MAEPMSKYFSGFAELLQGDHYVCVLDAATQKKACDELHEVVKERDAAVQQLRTWIQQQKHLKTCTETRFLLMFLRRCHYSQLEARRAYDLYHTHIYNHVPELSVNIDVNDLNIKKFLTEFKMCTLLPERDDEGRRIILIKPGCYEPTTKKGYGPQDILRSCAAMMEILCLEEATQVNGIVMMLDYTGKTMKHNLYYGLERFKNMIKAFFGQFPARFKAIHFYRGGPVLEATLAIIKPHLSTKLQDRIIIHPNMESIYKHIPMRVLPRDYLPDDYKGPCYGTMEDITANFYKELTRPEIRDKIWDLTHNQFTVDESLRPRSDVPQEAFRKLNVD